MFDSPQTIKEVFFVLIPAFFLGAIPVGFVVGKILGVDVRSSGSGNIGATNVVRVAGTGAGALTFFLDLLKGFAATFIPSFIRHEYLPAPEAIAGFAAVLGHCYSPFLVGSGGKGVATAFGVFLRLAPLSAFFGLAVFAIVTKYSRIVSLGSLAAVWSVVFLICKYYNGSFRTFTLLIGLIITFRHYDNVKRILDGTEHKFKR